MLAGPQAPIRLMRKALFQTDAALDAASEVDLDRTQEDRDFFAAEKAKLMPVAAKLNAAYLALDTFEVTDARRLQARVELGDEVLDRGVREGNARTKLGVKGKSGPDATHAFGQRINDLVDQPMHSEPTKVLAAAERLNDLPDFKERDAIKQDLIARATQQEKLLGEREVGLAKAGKLASDAAAAVVEGALALIQTKAALDGRFPRQRSYVAKFFLDVAREKKKDAEDGPEAGGSGEGRGGGSAG